MRLLLVQQFFEGFVPIWAFFALLVDRVGGFTFTEISILFALWTAAFTLSELPSGVLADYWSRHKIIVAGMLLRTIAFMLWLIFPQFLGYALGFILWGMAIACSSGSVAGYLKSELEYRSAEKHFARYFGYAQSIMQLGFFSSFVVASILGFEAISIILILSAAGSLLGGFIFLFAGESTYLRRESYVATLRAGLQHVLASRKLQAYSAVLFVTFTVYGVLEEYTPRIYDGFGVTTRLIAVLIGATFLLNSFVMSHAARLQNLSKVQQTLGIVLAILLLSVGLFVGGAVGVAIIFGYTTLLATVRFLFFHHVTDAVEGDEKSTIASLPGLLSGTFGVLGYFAISQMSNLTTESQAIAIYLSLIHIS